MKTFIALISALAATTVTAIPTNGYTPPRDMPDGEYTVNFDAAGNAVTTRADTGEVVALQDRSSASLETRQTVPFNCGNGCPSQCTGYDLDTNDYASVQHCMDNFLDRNAQNGFNYGVWYCKVGQTLLAVCNYSGNNYGGSAEINTFNGIMDGQCGNYRSGWVFISAWNKTYWRTQWGEQVCTNLGGDANSRKDITSDYSN